MRNPITTSLSFVGAIGLILVAAGKVMQGEAPDWTELTLAVTTLAGAIGLYKARDPGPRP